MQNNGTIRSELELELDRNSIELELGLDLVSTKVAQSKLIRSEN